MYAGNISREEFFVMMSPYDMHRLGWRMYFYFIRPVIIGLEVHITHSYFHFHVNRRAQSQTRKWGTARLTHTHAMRGIRQLPHGNRYSFRQGHLDLLRALRIGTVHGTDSFTSPPKDVILPNASAAPWESNPQSPWCWADTLTIYFYTPILVSNILEFAFNT